MTDGAAPDAREPGEPREVHVSAALIVDADGRALMVRKHGTAAFMQPGGKPEHGETAATALCRELAEELGVVVHPGMLTPLGRFVADAANEPGFTVVADVFALSPDGLVFAASAEIAELRWVGPSDAPSLTLAPLSLQHLLPLAWPGWRQGAGG